MSSLQGDSSLSLSEVIDGLRKKRFSCVEIASEYLKAIKEAVTLNAYLAVSEDLVIAEAARLDSIPFDQRGALGGAPIAIKDNILTKGITTTAGSKILEHFVPPYDATVVARIKEANGIILGKTNLDEFAMGSSNENSYFGPVKNPWNLECVPGGSSGGSAAAVAAGIAPAALGTDTGGSVRQPASFCGVLGLKPTYGRVSRYGVVAYASSLDQVGIIAQSTEDIALLLSIIGGGDTFDATSSRRPLPQLSQMSSDSNFDFAGLRIGLPKEYFLEGVDKEVEQVVMNVVRELEKQGSKIVEVSLPHTKAAVAVYYIIAPAEASSNLSRYDGVRYGFRASQEVNSLKSTYLNTRTQGFGYEVKRRIMIGTYVLSSGYYDAFYRKAQQVRTLITNDFTTAFKSECDVIVTPVTSSPAFKLGEKTSDPLKMYLSDIFTIPVNLAGLPAISVPGGFASSGLPIGVQFVAPHFQEELLLNLSFRLEKTLSSFKRTPKFIHRQ
jgi:aspartyl-tRNA(Asn)/glutamyl-tRNA(Gln) amidotransferase subunit A